jgi:hypothetical protein
VIATKKKMPKEINKRFYSDPEWYQVEEIIRGFIDPLMDMTTIDTTQPAESVKAEVIARSIAYNKLDAFLRQTKIIGQAKKPDINSPFR